MLFVLRLPDYLKPPIVGVKNPLKGATPHLAARRNSVVAFIIQLLGSVLFSLLRQFISFLCVFGVIARVESIPSKLI